MSTRGWVLFAASAGLLFWLASSAAPGEGSTEPVTASADFVGTDTCAVCHEAAANSFKRTPHAGSSLGCEGCHGAGKEHSEHDGDKTKIRDFKTIAPQESSAVCQTCHSAAGQKHWVGSSHDSRGIACVQCHEPHPTGAAPKALLRKPQMELCTGCHLQKKAQLLRSGHMPMREGKLQCTSCHNPHGTPNDKMLLQASVQQNCYSCHAEKRGPFLWEHPPVRENCVNCHDAHGSINDKLLKVRIPLLCQQCHQTASHPGPAYPAASRYAFNQACLHCHMAIHGSTHPSGNRFFR
jgi:DmsE family decaheme c-type cytochrome